MCSVSGKGSSSVHVKADGKDRVKLDAQMSHTHQREARVVGLKLNLSQSLLPLATDLHLNMAVNMSSDRCAHPLYFNTDKQCCLTFGLIWMCFLLLAFLCIACIHRDMRPC